MYANFPYGVLRLLPGVYQIIEPEAGMKARELSEHLQSYAVLAEMRCCLVLAKDRCIYFEPDGTSRSSPYVPDGIMIRLMFSQWSREPLPKASPQDSTVVRVMEAYGMTREEAEQAIKDFGG